MSKEWFSASELASLALPGIPQQRPNIVRKAQSEKWRKREREGRGGGHEYQLTSLPAPARRELARREAATAGELREEGEKEARYAKLQEKLQAKERLAKKAASLNEKLDPAGERRRDARLAILNAFDRFHTVSGISQTRARAEFETLYNRGDLDLPDWVYDEVANISTGSLKRWQAQVYHEGTSRLAGAYGSKSRRAYQSVIDQVDGMREFVLGYIHDHPHANIRQLYSGLKLRFKTVPSIRTVERYVQRWKAENRQLLQYLISPDKHRSRHQPAFGSASEGVIALNQIWEIDGTPADVMLLDPLAQRPRRYSIIGLVDIYSRRFALHVSPSESSQATAEILRKGVTEWGVPSAIKSDNGKGFSNARIDRVCTELEITQIPCPPFTPEAKPFVERAFRTFAHDLVELAGDFIGHDVAGRQAVRDRKAFADRIMQRGTHVEVTMTPAEFQEFADVWCSNIYGARPHDGLNGRSPLQMVAEYRRTGAPVLTISDEHALDVLLLPAPAQSGKPEGIRTIRKKGLQIKPFADVEGSFYYAAPELADRVGDEVFCLLDPDAGYVHVYTAEQEFLCIAECCELTGNSRQEMAARARHLAKQSIREQKREMQKMARRAGTKRLFEEIYEHAAGQRLHVMPGNEQQYSTPALDEHAKAARALQKAKAAPKPPEETPELRAIIARQEARDAQQVRYYMSDRERYEDLIKRRDRGETTEDENAWIDAWERGVEERLNRRAM